MKPEAELHCTIHEDGQVTIEVFNVDGPSCQKISEPFRQLFTDQKETRKLEFARVSAPERARQRT